MPSEYIKRENTSVMDFTSSIHFDKRLYKYDILGSIAHVKMLQKQKIVSEADGAKIIKGLKKIQATIEEGMFEFSSALEDIHMNIENALIELIGDIGGALHTARSRNDQVALDTRLYIRDEIIVILHLIVALQRNLLSLAKENSTVLMPGYTHLQHAQPIRFAHCILSYFYKLQRDFERFRDCYSRVNVNPLGSCALAGTSFDIDRNFTTDLLGFDKPCENAMDGVGDRDFVIETIFCVATVMMHLSIICEDVILWSSNEFGFIRINDSYTTGSSIMPQKKNPDIAELIRGKTGRVYGDLMSILTVMKALPSSYNRDMQEDKQPLFDSVDTVKSSLTALSKLLKGIKIMTDIEKNLETSFSNATDLADYITKKGIPFRIAYKVTKEIVSYCSEHNKTLRGLSLSEIKTFFPSRYCNNEMFDLLTIKHCVDSKTSYGGTSAGKVKESLSNAMHIMGRDEKIIAALTTVQKNIGVSLEE